ncbi:MAG: hypothetical protein WAW06_06135 [bacterium]
MRRARLLLLPLAVLYLAIALASPSSPPTGDTARYVRFAENLTRGHYSSPGEVNLWNGPGYPLMLAPFVALKLPWVWAKILNAALLVAALAYFQATLGRYVSPKCAVIATCVLGLWPPLVKMVPLLLSEVPSVFLVCGFAFHFCACQAGRAPASRARGNSLVHTIVSALFLGYLALTRVLFGYVALTLAVLSLAVYAWRRKPAFLRSALVSVLALVICLPYLVYTYSLTGRPFYWATSGGLSLYWMASPYQGDLGDWHTPGAVVRIPELARNHADFFTEIGRLSPVAQDDALRRRALENIGAHPGRYLANWVANLGRLIFNYPYSYRTERPSPWLHVIPGALLVAALAWSALALGARRIRRRNQASGGTRVSEEARRQGETQIPAEIWVLALFGLAAFGGSSLLSAFNRFLLPILPVALLWIASVFPGLTLAGPPSRLS